jgi:hypothetical protein
MRRASVGRTCREGTRARPPQFTLTRKLTLPLPRGASAPASVHASVPQCGSAIASRRCRGLHQELTPVAKILFDEIAKALRARVRMASGIPR